MLDKEEYFPYIGEFIAENKYCVSQILEDLSSSLISFLFICRTSNRVQLIVHLEAVLIRNRTQLLD